MKLIGITGRARSGKNTIGAVLEKSFKFNQVAFADNLKDIANKLGLVDLFFNDDIKEQPILNGKTPREFLQKLGSDWVKPFFGDDIWVRHMEKKYFTWFSMENSKLTITDVRFDIEADWIKKKGGTIIQVLRPSFPDIANKDHASERGINAKYVDYTIYNHYRSLDIFNKVLIDELTDIVEKA